MSVAPYTGPWFKDLGLRSLTDPRTAGAELLRLQPSRDALWTWLALLAVLNGLIYSLTMPSGPDMMMQMPLFFRSPVLLTIGLGALMVVMTQAFVLVGRTLGGQGAFYPMLLITCWLQTLRLAFQALVVLISTLSPGIGALAAMLGGIWGIFVLANFLTVAHRFASPLRAVVVLLVVATLASAFVLSFLLALLGVAPAGVA